MPKVIDEVKVFSAAIDLLVEQGYESATTKKIAAAAGIHEATLFRKYGSKLGLIERAIEKRFSVVPLNKVVYTGELQTDLVAIVQAYVDTQQLHGDILPALLAEIPRSPELKPSMQTPWVNIQAIVDILEQYQAQGMLKEEPPLNSVSVLIGPFMISQMIRRAALDVPVPDIDPEEHVDAFLHGRKQ